jgi:transposase
MANDYKVKQHIKAPLRYSTLQFHTDFPDDNACLNHIFNSRWPNGIILCPKCGVERKHYRVTNRTAYACDHCGTHRFPLVGTIFEKTSTPLKTWFYAMYLMGSTRCGISAKQVQRECGVTYKTAWRMFKQIRSVLGEPNLKLEGKPVEIDETYFGGVRKRGKGRPMRGDKKKTPIVAIVQRQGYVVARAIPDASRRTVFPLIRKHVAPDTVIYTDEFPMYREIPNIKLRGATGGTKANFKHFKIRHGSGIYVQGHIHTNSVEGLWSLIKRGISGVYHSVSPEYLQSYLNEYCFRYNRRHNGNLQFKSILNRASKAY